MSFILFAFIVIIVNDALHDDKQYEFPNNITGIVIEKNSTEIFGKEMYVLTNDSTIKSFDCYDILFDYTNVGDSIIDGKVKRNDE